MWVTRAKGGSAQHRMRGASLACSLAAASAACTPFESRTDERTEPLVTTESLDDGGNWSCLSEDVPQRTVELVPSDARRVILSLQIIELTTGAIFPDVQVRVCDVSDVNCERPYTGMLPTDENGWVDLPLFENFTGFIEIIGPANLPYLFHIKDPLPAESIIEYPLGVLAAGSIEPLAQLSGIAVEAGSGVLAARNFDCAGVPARDVSLTTDSAGIIFYFAGGLPTYRTTVTSDDGIGGVFNVPAGLVFFDAIAPTGASISGSQSVVIRPGWVSALFVRPPGGVRTAAER
jgi:hypothetical protein